MRRFFAAVDDDLCYIQCSRNIQHIRNANGKHIFEFSSIIEHDKLYFF